MASPTLRVIAADGTSYDDPTWDTLASVLSEMNLSYRFVILERLDREPVDEHYIQAYLNEDMSCQVEYRAGSENQHFQAHVAAPHELLRYEAIATLMDDWGHDRPGWREAVNWVLKPRSTKLP